MMCMVPLAARLRRKDRLYSHGQLKAGKLRKAIERPVCGALCCPRRKISVSCRQEILKLFN